MLTSKRAELTQRYIASRLTGPRVLRANDTTAESSDYSQYMELDHQNGVFWKNLWGNQSAIDYHWKRAPSYFDVVAYDGGISSTINHNLSAIPEMLWVKQRNGTNSWRVFIPSLNGMLKLNDTDALDTSTVQNLFGNGSSIVAPTATQFTVNSGNGNVNGSGNTYIAMLFSTVANVSKVGSYTGNGSTMTIDCGFSGSGARFVLIKRTDTTDNWYVWDSVRGIVSGIEPYLRLNNNTAETGSADYIDPHSSGFALPNDYFTTNGATFIFYAIA